MSHFVFNSCGTLLVSAGLGSLFFLLSSLERRESTADRKLCWTMRIKMFSCWILWRSVLLGLQAHLCIHQDSHYRIYFLDWNLFTWELIISQQKTYYSRDGPLEKSIQNSKVFRNWQSRALVTQFILCVCVCMCVCYPYMNGQLCKVSWFIFSSIYMYYTAIHTQAPLNSVHSNYWLPHNTLTSTSANIFCISLSCSSQQ